MRSLYSIREPPGIVGIVGGADNRKCAQILRNNLREATEIVTKCSFNVVTISKIKSKE